MDIADDISVNLIPIVYIMLKYVNYDIVFQEIPNETTLAINISNCPCHCKGCHSSYLAEDIGKVLTVSRIEKLITANSGITAICFMGGDNDTKLVNHYAKSIREARNRVISDTFITDRDIRLPKGLIPKGTEISVSKFVPNKLKIGWYSGRQELSKDIDLSNFDYIKLGPYIRELGGLKSPTTNQRLYEVEEYFGLDGESTYKLKDITNEFWK